MSFKKYINEEKQFKVDKAKIKHLPKDVQQAILRHEMFIGHHDSEDWQLDKIYKHWKIIYNALIGK